MGLTAHRPRRAGWAFILALACTGMAPAVSHAVAKTTTESLNRYFLRHWGRLDLVHRVSPERLEEIERLRSHWDRTNYIFGDPREHQREMLWEDAVSPFDFVDEITKIDKSISGYSPAGLSLEGFLDLHHRMGHKGFWFIYRSVPYRGAAYPHMSALVGDWVYEITEGPLSKTQPYPRKLTIEEFIEKWKSETQKFSEFGPAASPGLFFAERHAFNEDRAEALGEYYSKKVADFERDPTTFKYIYNPEQKDGEQNCVTFLMEPFKIPLEEPKPGEVRDEDDPRLQAMREEFNVKGISPSPHRQLRYNRGSFNWVGLALVGSEMLPYSEPNGDPRIGPKHPQIAPFLPVKFKQRAFYREEPVPSGSIFIPRLPQILRSALPHSG